MVQPRAQFVGVRAFQGLEKYCKSVMRARIHHPSRMWIVRWVCAATSGRGDMIRVVPLSRLSFNNKSMIPGHLRIQVAGRSRP